MGNCFIVRKSGGLTISESIIKNGVLNQNSSFGAITLKGVIQKDNAIRIIPNTGIFPTSKIIKASILENKIIHVRGYIYNNNNYLNLGVVGQGIYYIAVNSNSDSRRQTGGKEIDIYVNASLVRDLTATEIGSTGVSFGLIGSNGQFYGGSGGYFDIYDYELLNIK